MSKKLKILREVAQERGWADGDRYYAEPEELQAYIDNGIKPPIRYKPTDAGIMLSKRHITIDELPSLILMLQNIAGVTVPEKSVPAISGKSITEKSRANYQERTKHPGMNGRPPAPLPSDIAPLLETIKGAFQEQRPFTKSGRHGVYVRRGELPQDWQSLGRDKIERMIAGLIASGAIVAGIGGSLTVPDK